MRTAVDENVPGASEAFGQFGDVRIFSGRDVRRSDLVDVDALVVRSVTRVDATLLEGTPVRFVGTATIGNDHLDRDWLRRAGIVVADAAGSNSRSVAEYVVAALLELRARDLLAIAGDSIGIIGAGRIGTIVAGMARALGMEAVEYDPPRSRRDRTFTSAPLDRVLDCRIITLHVPLTTGCADPTWHLVDAAFVERTRSDAYLFNTSRGAVVSNHDLEGALRHRLIAGAVLDVWESEPDVPFAIVDAATIATPHIAGYSLDGKLRGTEMIAEAMSSHLDRTNNWDAASVLTHDAGAIVLPSSLEPLDAATAAMRTIYDIRRDDRALRAVLSAEEQSRRVAFDGLRRHYPIRREAAAYSVCLAHDEDESARTGAADATAAEAEPGERNRLAQSGSVGSSNASLKISAASLLSSLGFAIAPDGPSTRA